jgi:hypothetical protein
MGGVVSEVGEIGQGIISGVDEGLTQLDDAIPQEAKIAAAIYLASQGMPVGAEGAGFVGTTGSAIEAAEASQLAGLTGGFTGAVATPVTTGSILATELPAFGTTATTTATGSAAGALPPLSPVVQGTLPSWAGTSVAPVTAEGAAAGGLGSTQTSLLGGAFDWATASPQNALTAASLGLTAAKALGGSTPTSSTATTNIDPDVKAAYLRNLEEARATAAGLGTRQFAPYAEYNLGMVQKYMNPYEQQVIQGTLGDIERARQGQISAEGAAATAAKAFGGTRQGVTRSLVDEAALRNATNAVAQLRNTGFAQAQNLGLSQQQMMQQYEQQRLDAARNLGLERLNVAQGALSLQPARIGESTTTPLYQNTTASALGGALGGATLGKLIGGTANPEYAGYGAGIGGLLGLM